MTKKMKKQGGFTLVEMLIVVAIIAILIAVSIPLVTTSLEKAREATDAANERSFKAALTVGYLVGDANIGTGTDGAATGVEVKADGTVYAYDAAKGRVVASGDDVTPYGQGESGSSGKDSEEKKGKVLYGAISKEGNVYITWATEAPTSIAGNGTLTSELLGKSTATPATP